MAFNMFPWTNLHNLNTDWILKTIKELKTAAEQAASTVAGYATRLTALENSRVSYAAEQQLTRDQQIIARGNIGAAPAIGVVYYNEAQALSSDYKALARENIGAAAAGDIPVVTGVVHYDEAQSLADGEKTRARENIGAAAASTVAGYATRLTALENSRVSYAAEQQLTRDQQIIARGNIGAAPAIGVVYYNEAQALSSDYKALARENIGAAAASAIPDVTDVIRYSSQSLTTPQKQQARENIGAMSSDVNLPLEVNVSYDNGYSMDRDLDDILQAVESGVPVVITCVDVSTWPGFSSFTNLRNVSISQLHVIRSGSSNDFDIVGDALLSFDETTRKLQILHLNLSIMSGSMTIYPTVWGMLGAPPASAMDAGKWLKVDANGYPVWAALPVYQGGVS